MKSSAGLTSVACTAVLVVVAWQSAGELTHGFISYYAAARAVIAGNFGAWVYDDTAFGAYVQQIAGIEVREIFAPNTPAAALLALPVAWLPETTARAIWLAGSLGSLVGAVVWLAVDAQAQRSQYLAVLVAVALLNPAVFENLRTAQAYLLTFAALTAAVWALLHERDTLAGILLGVSCAIKPTLLPVGLVLLAQRRFRAVLLATTSALVVVVATVPVLTLQAWLAWPSTVASFVARPETSVTAYQTTTGLLRHACVPDPLVNPAPVAECATVARVIPLVLTIAALVVTFWAVPRTPPRLWIAAAVCVSLLAVPIAEDHQFVALAIPIMFLARSSQDRWAVLAVGIGLVLVPERLSWEYFTRGWWALFAYPRLYATWLLWAFSIAEMVRCRQQAAANAAEHLTSGA